MCLPKIHRRNVIPFIVLISAMLIGAERDVRAEVAQEDEARARELFRQGVDLSDEEQWEEAALRFEEAMEIRDAPAIRFNLAATLMRLGRNVEATNHLEIALDHEETSEELRLQIEERLAELEDQLGRLEIVLEGFDGNPQVMLDGSVMSSEQRSGLVWVEPGAHTATVEHEGTEISRSEVEISAGQRQIVTLRPIDPVGTTDVPENEERSLLRDWRLWVGVGGGVVLTALIFGLAFGLRSSPEDPIYGNMTPGVLVFP